MLAALGWLLTTLTFGGLTFYLGRVGERNRWLIQMKTASFAPDPYEEMRDWALVQSGNEHLVRDREDLQ